MTLYVLIDWILYIGSAWGNSFEVNVMKRIAGEEVIFRYTFPIGISISFPPRIVSYEIMKIWVAIERKFTIIKCNK